MELTQSDHYVRWHHIDVGTYFVAEYSRKHILQKVNHTHYGNMYRGIVECRDTIKYRNLIAIDFANRTRTSWDCLEPNDYFVTLNDRTRLFRKVGHATYEDVTNRTMDHVHSLRFSLLAKVGVLNV
jgi:hypothetical protein